LPIYADKDGVANPTPLFYLVPCQDLENQNRNPGLMKCR
jgi:hypothetical protein